MPYDDSIAPPREATEDQKLGWLKEAVRQGETFIRNQYAYQDFERAKQIIAGMYEAKMPAQLSRIQVNMTKRLVRDIVATMSNLRPLWGYSTDNRNLDKISELLNNLLLNWYQSTFADRGIKKTLQYAAVYGTGYIGPDWKKDLWTRGRGDITLNSYSPEDVLPVQLPKDGDIQRAYATTLKESTPINLARAMFPTKAHLIVADRQSPSGLRKGLGRMASFVSPVLNRFGATTRAKKAIDKTFPEVDIYQTYILDLSVNMGPDPIVMGEPGTYWNYIVPVMGSQIPDGVDGNGTPKTRTATVEDSMIYPFRRLVTWCNSAVLRDDTSYWWHGMVPVVKMAFDEWAWEFLGYSMTRDLASIEDSSNTLRRAADDCANARMRPALQYDDRTIAQGLMQSLDTRVPGQAVGVDMTIGGDPIRPILPSEYYDVPPFILEMIKGNDEMMKFLSGVVDFTAIAKAAQIPSSDTVEKIFEQAGPMVTDISRNMESSLGRLGEMIKCLFFEFYTAGRRLEILGDDGLTKEDSDYFDPSTLVPDHLPSENPETPSIFNRVERAKRFMNNFFFKITPNSLHQITQMSRKLLYIQLQKAGMPMDPWTMAMVLDIPNFGRPPRGADTVFQRWVAFEKIKGELTAQVAAKGQEILGDEQIQQQLKMAAIAAMAQQGQQGGAPGGGPPPEAGGAVGGPGGVGPSPALGHNLPGRPPEFQGTPVLESKDGGTRSTITSK